MGEKDDGLGLGLSLGSFGLNSGSSCLQQAQASANLSATAPHLPLNLFKPSLQNSGAFLQPPTAVVDKEHRSKFRGIDMNRPLTIMDCGEEDNPMASSPNSTVSSLSGKRTEREEKEDGERASSSLEVDEDGGDASGRKKLRLSKEQAVVLEETFKEHNTLNPKEKIALAKQLNLMPRQVEVWFQNRRARTKLKQTEVDCEYLRRCCENLTEENRRLQKEVSELRALKLSPQFYMSPPTTLTMCPQCERVAAPSSAPGSSGIAPSTRPPSHHQGPVGVNSWAAIISPRSIDAPHRPMM